MAETKREVFAKVAKMYHGMSHSNKNARNEMHGGLNSSVDPYDSLRNLAKTKRSFMPSKDPQLGTLVHRVRESLRSQTWRHALWSCCNKENGEILTHVCQGLFFL